MKHRLDSMGYNALRTLAFFLGKLPHEVAVALGWLAGGCAFYVSNRRHVAYADVKAALGNSLTEKERWKCVREQFGHLGQMFDQNLRDRFVVEQDASYEHFVKDDA